MRDDLTTRTALARWQVIAAATDDRLTPAERGMLLSELAAQVPHQERVARA